MKRVKFKDEAERLNVSVEAVVKTYQKLLDENKIYGIIDATECISFTSEEIESLGNLLSSKPLQVQALTEELRLERDHIHLIIKKLMMENRIKGQFTQDGMMFIPDSELRSLIIKASGEIGRIDISEISSRLLIPRESILPIIEEMTKQIIKATTPYTQIKFIDLSRETDLPEDFLLDFVKSLISDSKIVGSIDMVNRILKIERVHLTPSRPVTVETRKEGTQVNPTYILTGIIIFTVLAGIIVYSSMPKGATFTIKIESNTQWAGSIGANGSSKSVEGYGGKTFEVRGTIAVAVIQKQTEDGYLRVSIICEGRVLDSQTTSAAYGVVSVSAKV